MKYIATYNKVCVDADEARRAHEEEFYRKLHNVINARSLGVFTLAPDLNISRARGYAHEDELEPELNDEWIWLTVSTLFFHLVESTGGRPCSINGFATHPAARAAGWKEGDLEHVLEIKGGYTAFISESGEVLAEAYVASSRNAVVVVHEKDRSILCVDSRRHGIPGLANQFREMTPKEVLLYNSWRKDTPWYEAGLEPKA